MTKVDFVIVFGDFGGVWNGSQSEDYWLNWLEKKPFTTLFVSGNHENYDRLALIPIVPWRGGRVQKIRPSILHLVRGQVFELCGKRVFTMGGASSHDITDGILNPDAPDFHRKKRQLDIRHALYRVNRQTWWAEELPSDEEYLEAGRNLEHCGWNVDFILSHCCPSSVADIISEGRYQHDRLTDYFETLRARCQFDYWFFGHHHDNRVMDKKYILLYEQILQVVPFE